MDLFCHIPLFTVTFMCSKLTKRDWILYQLILGKWKQWNSRCSCIIKDVSCFCFSLILRLCCFRLSLSDFSGGIWYGWYAVVNFGFVDKSCVPWNLVFVTQEKACQKMYWPSCNSIWSRLVALLCNCRDFIAIGHAQDSWLQAVVGGVWWWYCSRSFAAIYPVFSGLRRAVP